jgi:hypothetical protein|tara:strand:+ start:260 stop:526 length:267 start_codon:yes stop_codon:yes gene_type:complete
MGRVKDEVIQLEEDISDAIDKLEKMLGVNIREDIQVYEEITTNPTYLEFIKNHVNDFGLSVFKDKEEVERFLKNRAKDEQQYKDIENA